MNNLLDASKTPPHSDCLVTVICEDGGQVVHWKKVGLGERVTCSRTTDFLLKY